MTSGIEAVGDAATGAVIAGTVEPGHGDDGPAAHGVCLNCATPLVGTYCHACGQNSHLHRTITGFLHDMLHGVFHFEGKIWTTLPMLLFKPGKLTRRYIAGERARFVSPMAMFLFCVFLMFAVVGGLAGDIQAPAADARYNRLSKAEIDKELGAREAQIKTLRTQIKDVDRRNGDTTALEKKLADAEQEKEGLTFARRLLPGESAGEPQNQGRFVGGITTGWPTLDHGIRVANENPNLFLYRLQTSAYKYSWLLIPISTPLVWLLFFWKRQYKFYDHLVFVTLSITFMLLLVTAVTLAGWLGLSDGLIVAAMVIIPPLHLYRQVRGAYASSRLGALARTAVLLVFAFAALILYLLILLALGVMH